jgi:hypothetical protein
VDDDLCLVCGCCPHDHKGWKHKWVAQAEQDMDRITASGEDLSQEPDEWGYGPNGEIVDLR